MKRLLLIVPILLILFFYQSAGQTISIPARTSFPCQTVSFPVIASGFPVGDVGAITLFININTNVIGYVNNSPGTLTGYYLSYNSSNGLITIAWTYTPTYPPTPGPDVNGTLLTLNFQYYGCLDTLEFRDDCEVSSIGPPAENIPTTYIDGLIGPNAETIYYVDSTVVASGNGLSWGTALKKISEAANKPLKAGDKVLIKPYHYNDTVIIKSNGLEVVPLTFNVTVSDTNKITFPGTSDFSCIDLVNYPGKYYAYLGRSWKGNNGVYKITQVNKTSKYVIVEGAEFTAESGGVADSALLQASIGLPVTYEKYATDPQTERVTLSSSGISGERAALHIGTPTSAGDFNVNAANYNIINGIDITGADQVGVRIQNSKFNVYKNSRIYELDSIGLMISGNTAKPANNNFILNNVIYNTKKKAVKIGIQGETAANNRANLNHIKGNEIYSTTGANINYINAIEVCHYTGFTVIESNTLRNFKLSQINRGVIELKNSVRRVLAYSNFIKNIDRVNLTNTHSIFYLQNNGNNNKIYNNVIVDSAAVANDIFAFWVNGNGGYTAGLIAYNSVHKVDNGFKLESGSTNVNFEIKDNIMNLDPTTPEQFNTSGTGTFTVSYNCYSTDPGSYYSSETGRLIANPLFLLPGNYLSPYALSLQASSPCLNTGNPVSGIVTDFRKRTRNSTAPSRGAFEQVLSNIYWTGEINTSWYDYRNWDVRIVPSSAYNVTIPDRSNDPLISNSGASCKSLHVQPGALLKVKPTGSITIYP
jgi:hypothetical protein